jgi:dTDP-4-dehydrorhamnose 3,5-epimerase
MTFHETALAGAYVIEPEPFRDERGFFARIFCEKEFGQIGHRKPFLQINHSFTVRKGTVRGLHYQVPPSAEIKLIRCIGGEVYDVIIDLRRGSPTFLQHTGIRLSAENMNMLYVPEGFAHGFQTLQENTQMIYHHTEYYTPSNERGLSFRDPAFGIAWPLDDIQASDKDLGHKFIDNSFTGIEL